MAQQFGRSNALSEDPGLVPRTHNCLELQVQAETGCHYSPGWPPMHCTDQAWNSQKSSCLCLPSAGLKGVHHHHLALTKGFNGLNKIIQIRLLRTWPLVIHVITVTIAIFITVRKKKFSNWKFF